MSHFRGICRAVEAWATIVVLGILFSSHACFAETITDYTALSPTVSYYYYAPPDGPTTDLSIVSPTVSYQYYAPPDGPITDLSVVSPPVSYRYFDNLDSVATPVPVTSPIVSYYSGSDFGAVLAVAPLTQPVAVTGGTLTFNISNTGTGTIHWSARIVTGSGWLALSAPVEGDNTGTLAVVAEPNPYAVERTGKIEVSGSGQSVELQVTQAALAGEGEGEPPVEGEPPTEGEPGETWTGNIAFNSPVAGLGYAVKGLCTDGTATVRIEIDGVPSGLTASGLSCAVTPSGGALSAVSLNAAAHTALWTYTAPSSYPTSANNAQFTVNVSGVKKSRTLSLARPPVVMLHGWGGVPEKWNEMAAALTDAGFRFTYAHNYHATSNSRFAVNRDEAFLAVCYAKKQAWREQYAVLKADVIAHSMGGIVGRYYIQGLSSVAYQNNIRRFITIGTPHSGSEFANIAVLMRDAPYPLGAGFTKVARAAGLVVDEGAVDDLSVDSHAIEDQLNVLNLGQNAVMSHAIIGSASTPDPPEGWARVVWKAAKFLVSDVVADSILGVPNDVVVGGVSQSGGLSTETTTTMNVLWHLVENTNPEVISRVVQLLDASNTAAFAPQGFTAPKDINFLFDWDPFKAAVRHAGQSDKSGTINILSPVNETTVTPGDTITVNTEGTGTVNAMLVLTPFDAGEFTGTTCSYSFQAPQDFLGELPIMVLGRDDAGVVGSALLTLHVATSASVTALHVYPEGTLTVAAKSRLDLQVIADFSDGISRDVTSHGLGTTYTPGAPSLITVSQDGSVTGISEGSTSIVISNGVSTTVNIEVMEALVASVEGEGEGEGEALTEGEGEGEAQPPASIEDAARALLDHFETADSDHSGGLSEQEATLALPGLTHEQFVQLDANGDGQLTQDELNQVLNPGGCSCNKSGSAGRGLKQHLADIFMLGLALFTLVAFRRLRQ